MKIDGIANKHFLDELEEAFNKEIPALCDGDRRPQQSPWNVSIENIYFWYNKKKELST